MRILLASLLLAAATVSTPGTAIAKSDSAVFSDTWLAREARYTSELASDQQRLKSAVEGLSQAIIAGDSTFQPALEEWISASTAMGYADGRLGAIMSLRKLMATKPREAALELWMQDQADSLKRASDTSSAQLHSALAQRAENGATTGTQLNALTLAYIVTGRVKGAADELLLIHANLGSFMQAKNAADQRRRAAIDAVSQGLSDYSQRLLSLRPPPSWSATCSTTGGFTRCSGG